MEGVTSIGSSIVSTVVEAIKGLGQGIAETAVDVFNAVCVNESGNISNLAIWGLVIGAIGITTALVRRFTSKVG